MSEANFANACSSTLSAGNSLLGLLSYFQVPAGADIDQDCTLVDCPSIALVLMLLLAQFESAAAPTETAHWRRVFGQLVHLSRLTLQWIALRVELIGQKPDLDQQTHC